MLLHKIDVVFKDIVNVCFLINSLKEFENKSFIFKNDGIIEIQIHFLYNRFFGLFCVI